MRVFQICTIIVAFFTCNVNAQNHFPNLNGIIISPENPIHGDSVFLHFKVNTSNLGFKIEESLNNEEPGVWKLTMCYFTGNLTEMGEYSEVISLGKVIVGDYRIDLKIIESDSSNFCVERVANQKSIDFKVDKANSLFENGVTNGVFLRTNGAMLSIFSKGIESVQFLDLNGKLLLTEVLSPNLLENTVFIEHLPKQLLVARFKTHNGYFYKKLNIE